jgi:dCMP deaminase
MICTHAPCLDCAKLIHQAGIKRFYFRSHYRSEEGLKFLNKCEIEVNHVKDL